MTTPATAGSLTTEGTLALVVERLADLKAQQEKDTATLTAAIEALRVDTQQQGRVYVPRQEWEQRNRLVDERHESRGKEIADLRTELTARRVSWPAVVGGVAGAGSLLLVIIQYVAT